MNSTELKDYFRSQVRDNVAPYLWTDEELFTYMNAAQQMFVRLTGGIFDVSSEATEVSIAVGEQYSELHPSILHIRKAVISGVRELKLVNLGDADKAISQNDYLMYRQLSLVEVPGPVTHMVIGEERNKCRWLHIPEADATVKLSITRMPLVDITGEGQQLEVPAEHHVYMVDGMKSLAYLKQDADTFDPKSAVTSEERFVAYCKFVWKEWERYRHKPRTVMYAGI